MNKYHIRICTLAMTLVLSFSYAQIKNNTQSEKTKDIEEVVLISTTDIAKDRKTPVATSTVKNDRMVNRIGNQDIPEILKNTPSVYVTKSGGGFGDGRISIRGFSINNIAVMINGVPVNDMESGVTYFSNFQGLSDVTSALHVQRGLGSSKLAIASFGGSINFITRAADKNKGGVVNALYANDEYIKTTASYGTGKTNSGWSSSVLVGRTLGNMLVYGTKFEANNYYFALGYNNPLSNHDFQFTITAAPEWHMQNSQSTIATYQKYGTKVMPNRRYNPNWGYLEKDEYSQAINYYSEPIASLNWDWKIANSRLSSVVYASWGRGGGTGILGNINGKDITDLPRTRMGLIRFDDIVKWNKGEDIPDFGAVNTNPRNATRSNGVIRISNINSHNLYGFLTNFKNKVNNNWNISVGLDGRYYYGYHTGIVSDFLGNNSYTETHNRNIPNGYVVKQGKKPQPSVNPFVKAIYDSSQIVSRNYDGEILWGGIFGQAEYSDDKVSTFVQGSLSEQGFQRYDHWIVDGVTKQQDEVVNKKTGFKYILGFNLKTGANIILDENNNVFANFGYYSKQPNNYVVFPYPQLGDHAVGNQQIVNKQLTNEKILSAELGYGFRSKIFNTSINLYCTSWKDRFKRFTDLPSIIDPETGTNYNKPYANITGINEIHLGIEYELELRLTDYLKIEGMLSTGTWYYNSDVLANLFDQNGKPIIYNGHSNIGLAFDGVKVSDAAQTTASIGITLKPLKNMSFWSNYNYYDGYYGLVNFNEDYILNPDGTKKTSINDALKYPSYGLMDLGFSYSFGLGYGQSLVFTGNIYNLLDTYYISDASTSISADSIPEELLDGTPNTTKSTYRELGYTYKGIANANRVYFGSGRTWSFGLSYKF